MDYLQCDKALHLELQDALIFLSIFLLKYCATFHIYHKDKNWNQTSAFFTIFLSSNKPK